MEKLTGKKFYAVVLEANVDYLGYVNSDIEDTKKGLNNNWPYLVELTVTRVYTRERDLKEIETN